MEYMVPESNENRGAISKERRKAGRINLEARKFFLRSWFP
jgi:hypothetical protein